MNEPVRVLEDEGTPRGPWKVEGLNERVGATLMPAVLDLMRQKPLPKDAETLLNKCDNKQRSLYYSDFVKIMNWTGLTVRDLFRAMGAEIFWPNDEFREIAESCEKLPDPILRKARDMAAETSPTWPILLAERKPSVRLVEASLRKTSILRERKRKGRDSLPKSGQTRLIRLTPEKMVEESMRMGISMHWILKLDPNHLIYGTKPEIEEILDAYSFMQPSVRMNFVAAFCELAERVGGAEYENR